MRFDELNISDNLKNGLKEISFETLTPIQELVIPNALNGDSIIIQSATGSGKTHSYLVPLLQRINPQSKDVQALIILPTRELAMQIYNVTCDLIKKANLDYKVARIIGGSNREQEMAKIENGDYQIVIGTLGRLKDLVIKENILKIYNANCIVIDEADMIFDQNEIGEVDNIIGVIQGKPQFLVSSATITKGLEHFLKKYLENLSIIRIEEDSLTKKSITHSMILCKAKDKMDCLIDLLKIINPYLVLIFGNTTVQVDEISEHLAKKGFKVAKLHGNLSDYERKQTIKRINSGVYQYVVASDIVSRGIDLEGVSHVINFDLPKDIEFYIHRTGRTARFDQNGVAYTLYGYSDDAYVKKLKAKGLIVIYQKIVNGELVEATFKKVVRTKAKTYEEALHEKIPLSKKVKPGYKKKRNEQIKKLVQKAKHAHIDELYRKKGHK